MYQALYRKYRPQTFDDVVGQSAVTTTLKTQLQTGRLSHAYLFTGSRGTGKTSSAKILAKAVNCLDPRDGNPCCVCEACKAIDSGSCMDVLEIDAASNNGVDNVRDLRDDAVYSPSQVRKRVYIIDEVHMLSLSAFNALLKIIEEPPEHLLFILATTELHKVPATILSRCQRFSFRRISQEDIAARLQYVAYQEGIDLEDGAARVLSRLADGGMRDGLSLLDQCASAIHGSLTAQRVYECLGVAGARECAAILTAVGRQDAKDALSLLDETYAQGKDMGALLDELACLIRDILVLLTAPDAGLSLLSGVASDSDVRSLAAMFTPPQLVRMMNLVQTTLAGFTRSASRRMDTELCILNLCRPELALDAESLNARLSRLEAAVKAGIPAAPQQPETQEPEANEPNKRSQTDGIIPQPAENVKSPQKVGEEVPDSPDSGLFWPDLATQIRAALKPPVSGFFAPTPNAPVQGQLRGNTLELLCANAFTAQVVSKPEILALVAQHAKALTGRELRVTAVDRNARPAQGGNMEQLLNFGKSHGNIVKIKEN